MPIKHPRHDTDIAAFARELAGRWRQGDGVEPWLRALEPELSRKVRSERWSWESVARALNVAGIQYRTARAWSGASLLQKITSIRYEARKRTGKTGADPQRTGIWAATLSATQAEVPSRPAPLAGTQPPAEDKDQEFRPAALMGHGLRKPAETHLPPRPVGKDAAAPATSPAIDVDEVLARFTGQR